MKTLWMPIYWPNYLADTEHFTTVEHGAYLLLIAHYWCNGGLPSDDVRLARIAKMTPQQWSSCKATIHEKFEVAGTDFWRHKRIDQELTKALKIQERRRENHRRATAARRSRGRPLSGYTYTYPVSVSKTPDAPEKPAPGFKASPNSPEFEKWKAWAFDKHKALWRELVQRTQEGRAFDFETQWPPN